MRIPGQAKPQARPFRYGPIPSWANDPHIGNPPLNVRLPIVSQPSATH